MSKYEFDITLFFDKAYTELLVGFRRSLLPSVEIQEKFDPHITLSICYAKETNTFEELAGFISTKFLSGIDLEVKICGLGIFPSHPPTFYLSVTPSTALMKLQFELFTIVKDLQITIDPRYTIDNWMPHVTLLTTEDFMQTSNACTVAKDLGIFRTVKITKLALVSYCDQMNTTEIKI